MNTHPDKTIVYVLGSSHSGSTLLSALLGAQNGIVCLGETSVFSAESARIKPLEARICSCRQGNWRQCPFWQAAEQALRQTHKRSLAELDLASPDDERSRRDQEAFWSVIFRLVPESILVDSSKKIENYLLLTRMNIPVIPLYLSRSPYGVVYSEIKKGKNWFRETFGYLHYNMRARLALRGKKHLRVRYEDLALRPGQTLQTVLSFLQTEPSAPEMDWTSKTQHLLRGNGMILKNDNAIIFDGAWKTGLSAFQKAAICLITLPLKLEWRPLYALYLGLYKIIKRHFRFFRPPMR